MIDEGNAYRSTGRKTHTAQGYSAWRKRATNPQGLVGTIKGKHDLQKPVVKVGLLDGYFED